MIFKKKTKLPQQTNNQDIKNYFPLLADKNENIISNFQTEEEVLSRQSKILEHQNLPFVFGYLYSYDGNTFNNYEELKKYNNDLEQDYRVYFSEYCYSVDGILFQKFENCKKYNEFILGYYSKEFNFPYEEKPIIKSLKW